jgi:hypothetical protein
MAAGHSQPVARSATLAAARGTLPPSNPTTPNEKCKMKSEKLKICPTPPSSKLSILQKKFSLTRPLRCIIYTVGSVL